MVAVRGVQAFEGFAAIDGAVEAGIGDVNLIGILGVGPNVGEIPGALTEAVIVVDERPVGAAVIAAVEAALFRFDERVNDFGLGAGNRNADAAERTFGDAVAFDALPGCAVVARTVDTVAEGDVAANTGFAASNVNYIRIRIGDGNGANGRGGLLLEERIPGVASVSGFPNASADSTKIESVRLAGDSSDGQRASAPKGTDEAPLHAAVGLGID